MLLNAGGVTVSYMEWIKGLSHVRFGRINKRWEEKGKASMVQMVEEQVGRTLTEGEKRLIVQGAEEHELVYSGLDTGFAISPIVFGVFMDHGWYGATLLGAALALLLSVGAALGVGQRTKLAP